MEIRLGETVSKTSVNNEFHTNVALSEESKILLGTELRGTIDEYKQYLAEKDASTKYNFIFTLDPVCTNVLFNTVSEIVYKEGSDDCIVFDQDGPSSGVTNANLLEYNAYHNKAENEMTRRQVIKDTSYSSADIGPLVYHCGMDIFNNHILRNKDFVMVNKTAESGDTPFFNTIEDYIRDYKGNQVQEIIPRIFTVSAEQYINVTGTTASHLYLSDTVLSYKDSIRANIAESDGWLGFFNKANLEYPNYKNVSLNKVMNNNKVGEFIDMYPDRSLYSFVPKYNKYRNRYENNWDICLTYPYKNIQNNATCRQYESDGVGVTIEGLRCPINNDEVFYISGSTVIPRYKEGDTIWLNTTVKHSFTVGSLVLATFIYKVNAVPSPIYHTWSPNSYIKITNVGLDGYDFAVEYSEISGLIDNIPTNDDVEIEMRLRRCENGKPCKYYMRVFKKIPNFIGTEIYNKTYVTDEEVNKYAHRDFNHTLNKMAFERTIYNDNKCQLIYNDPVDVKGLKDNLGRDLSEVYLTFVKRNKGREKWYGQKDYQSEDIEFSHCFGKVTAGFDSPYWVDDYNVHKLNGLNYNTEDGSGDIYEMFPSLSETLSIPRSPNALNNENGEGVVSGITIDGDDYLKKVYGLDDAFFGDLVEFSEYTLTERVLEDVYFRFNTEQRETLPNSGGSTESGYTGEYANIYYDKIVSDDQDTIFDNQQFQVEPEEYNKVKLLSTEGQGVLKEIHYPANLYPEGYYHKAHHKIQIKEWDDKIHQGNHIRLRYIVLSINYDFAQQTSVITLKTIGDFYIRPNDVLYLYKKDDSHQTVKVVVDSVDPDDYRVIHFKLEGSMNFVNYVVYRKNPAMPSWAYELNDGTGRYIWKEMKKEESIRSGSELYNSMFTNGTHYIHKNINFYLHRQDPTGENGLLYGEGTIGKAVGMTISGDVTANDHMDYVPMEENMEGSIC